MITRNNDAFVAKIVNTRLTNIFVAIFAGKWAVVASKVHGESRKTVQLLNGESIEILQLTFISVVTGCAQTMNKFPNNTHECEFTDDV